MNRFYFDYAAATPVHPAVLTAMQPYFSEKFHNPSALYTEAVQVHRDLESARSSVARSIGSRPSEIIFTAGGSESINLAIKGVMSLYPDKHMVVSAVEHEAVMRPSEHYQRTVVAVNEHGVVSVDALSQSITDETVLVSVMLANNEVGSLQPITDIAKQIETVRVNRKKAGNTTPIYLHTDACQAPLYLDVHISRLGVDLLTLNGGKMYGPKQSGVLYVRAGVRLQPLIEGGGQEFGYRHGTENVAFAIGFAKALELAEAGRHERVQSITELRDYFIQRLTEEFDAILHGHPTMRLANNVHVSFTNKDNERVLFALDELGVLAAAGSACSASNDEPSHVLKAMGLSDEVARSSIRFTLGEGTTKEAIDAAIAALEIALNR